MDEDAKLAVRLTKIYAKLLGERDHLIAPATYLTRLIPERAAHDAEAPIRAQRLAEIDEALPHVAYVIGMLDASFDEKQVKPLRPRRPNRVPMPNGIAGTALDIVRECTEPLATAEIVQIMGERYGLDLSTVRERQRYYNSINAAFVGTYRDDLVEHPGHLPDNPGWRRRWSWRHASDG